MSLLVLSYRGETHKIPCDRGGLSANPNIDTVADTEMIWPSRNLNLEENGRRKRGGTSLVNEFVFDNGTPPQIMGIYDFRLVDGTQTIIVAGDDGYIYDSSDATTSIKSGMSTTSFFDFETFENELYIFDGKSTPEKWTGAGATATLTDIPSDWTGANMPQWVVKHGRGASERLWAGGCPTSTPQTVYASENGDGDDFSDVNVTTINIETGDGFGIVGAIEFGDRLLCFGKSRAYVIEDTNTDASKWGYEAVQWDGGAANFRLIARTPTDVVAMMEDGNIYSVVAAETYGDYKQASLTKASFMHRYIKEHIKLSAIDQFHMVYDSVLRAIKIFVVRNGQTDIDTALVYFIDKPPEEAWMVHDNQSSASGYTASVSASVRVGAGDYEIYTGDYSGNIWQLEQANRNDNDEAYYAGMRTGHLNYGDSRIDKRFKRGWLVTQPEGSYNLVVDWWVDSVQKTQRTVSLVGTGGLLGSFTLGTSLLGGQTLINEPFMLGEKGKRIQYEIYNSSVNEDFFISQILTDFKPLGKKAD